MSIITVPIQYDTNSQMFTFPDGTTYYWSGALPPEVAQDSKTTVVQNKVDDVLKLKAADFSMEEITELKEKQII